MNSFQLDLQEHCDLLSRALSELTYLESSGMLLLAADWLNLASGVCHVKIQTDRFDESSQYCGGAYRFEHARSILLSRLATHLTIFNFAWGAFETVAKVIDPSPIPVPYRPNGGNSIVCGRSTT